MTEHTVQFLGWGPFQDAAWTAESGRVPARISAEHRGQYLVRTAQGELPAQVTGRLMFQADVREDYPVVGDWVEADLLDQDTQAILHRVLPRRTLLARRAAGSTATVQPIAANVDVVFVVMGLDGDFNVRRMERYLVMARDSGAQPVVLLTKWDLAEDGAQRVAEAQAAAHADVLAVSTVTGTGLEDVQRVLAPGVTACFVGSSGVGKSTLVNRLAGQELLRTAPVREDDSRGRHTTTHRQLFLLPSGGLVIDTPGMRELGVLDAGEGLSTTFTDVDVLATGCHFRDCTHVHEDGCAVRTALEEGTLDAGRYQAFLKLRREALHLDTRLDPALQREKKARDRLLAKAVRDVTKRKGRQ